MSAQPTSFNRGVIRPFECFSEGWRIVKTDYWLMVGVGAVGILVGSIAPFGILLGPMMCGIHMCVFALQRGERPTFNLLFKGFDLFMPSFIATLVQMVPAIVLLVPVYLVFIAIGIGAGLMVDSSGEPPPGLLAVFVVGFLLVLCVVFVGAVLVGTFFAFAYQLIVDRGLSGWDACKTSARAALGNIGGVLGLMLVNALLGVVGVALCYVGAFFVLPISFAAFDVAYRRVFPPAQPQPSPHAPPPQYPNYGERFTPGQ